MKKLTFILLLFLPSIIFAQDKISFGVKAGIVNSFAPSKYSNKLGLSIGGFVNIPLNKTFSFQPEILYTSKGFKIKGVPLTDINGAKVSTKDITYNYNYIEVPLLLKASLGKPYFIAGLTPSFLLSSTKEANTIDLGATLGAGIEFKISEKAYIFLEPRFNYGVTSYAGNFKNQSLYLLAGIRF